MERDKTQDQDDEWEWKENGNGTGTGTSKEQPRRKMFVNPRATGGPEGGPEGSHGTPRDSNRTSAIAERRDPTGLISKAHSRMSTTLFLDSHLLTAATFHDMQNTSRRPRALANVRSGLLTNASKLAGTGEVQGVPPSSTMNDNVYTDGLRQTDLLLRGRLQRVPHSEACPLVAPGPTQTLRSTVLLILNPPTHPYPVWNPNGIDSTFVGCRPCAI
ncbi:hypothetical protein BDV10DRAFT_185408 [Aspergillus recurvatus]